MGSSSGDESPSRKNRELAGRFHSLIGDGNELLHGHGASETGSEHAHWVRGVEKFLIQLDESGRLAAKWASFGVSPLLFGGYYYDQPEAWAAHNRLVGQRLAWLAESVPPHLDRARLPESIWGLFHPQIVSHARERFLSRQYADAVEAAFKEVNNAVKQVVRSVGGRELDGATLMNHAFSEHSPIIRLAELDTQSGRDTQKGYMLLYSGAMTGIRNPKAHEHIEITPERAIHHLFLASLLMRRLDERIAPPPEG